MHCEIEFLLLQFSLANEMISLLLYRCAGVSQNCGGIGHIATIC